MKRIRSQIQIGRLSLLGCLILTSGLSGQEVQADIGVVPAMYQRYGDDFRRYDEHVSFLANPFLEGRLPGSPGMVITERYVEENFAAAGLQPAFDGSFRQSVPLGGQRKVEGGSIQVGAWNGERQEQFDVNLLGGQGSVQGPLVFAGFGVDKGPDGYSNFLGDRDLQGRIAVVYRFEPMNESGTSRWTEDGRWSRQASYRSKLMTAASKGAKAIILVNPPGVSDPRAGEIPVTRSNRKRVDVPVFGMTTEALDALLKANANPWTSEKLLAKADKGGPPFPLGLNAELEAKIEQEQRSCDNIGGLLPGQGELAKELVVIGAHIDHLGLGVYGSRGFRGELHPGADDNASGTAALILLAERIVPWMAALEPGQQARSVLFLGLNAEEAGLDGARHYVNHPIRSLEDHSLMINFDMIGRVVDGKLQILGSQSGEGLMEWMKALDAETPLHLNVHTRLHLGSDHLPFLSKRVPAVFAIIDPLHRDYHTPGDVASKINRLDSIHVIDLFEKVIQGAATRPKGFEFKSPY